MADLAVLPPRNLDGYDAILAEDVDTSKRGQPPVWEDKAAAALVRQDYEKARAYLENNRWILQWQENDILYQSPVSTGPSETDRRYARVARFNVNNETNTMTDAVKQALFSQKPCVFLRQRGQTTQNQLKAWTALLDVLFDRMNFVYWVGLAIESQGLHGTGVGKGGWSTRKRVVRKRKRTNPAPTVQMPVSGPVTVPTLESYKSTVERKVIEESYPWFETRTLGTTLFDPGWRTPNKPELCKYAIDIDYPTWTDLEQLRNEDCYDIPDADWLKDFFFTQKVSAPQPGTDVERQLSYQGGVGLHADHRATSTTADPLNQPLLMLERTDAESVKTVLMVGDRVICIRNGENELGRIPHFSANWRNIINAGWGLGLGKLIGGDQRLETGVLNHSINLLAYQLSPAVLIAIGGGNAPTQNREVRAGGFFPVMPVGDDVRKAMAVMEMPSIPAEAWQMIQYARESSERTSGADSTFMQGQLGGRGSSAARTATGAGAISQKSNSRIQSPVDNVADGIIVPYTNMLIDMVRLKMPYQEITQILSDKLAKTILDDIDSDFQSFMDAQMQVEVLAGARLQAKAAMASQLPFLMQVFQQPQLLEQLHQEGKTVDYQVIFDILFTVSEFRAEDEIIRPMSQDELNLVGAMSQAGIQQQQAQAKAQSAVAVEQQRGQNALEKSDRDAENKLGADIALKALEKTGGGIPLTRAEGLVMRGQDEDVLRGNTNFIGGAYQ